VQSVEIMRDRETGNGKGFGFVEMGSDAEAQAAIQGMQEREVDGRRLTVDAAKPRKYRSGGGFGNSFGDGGGYGGGGHGYRGGGGRGRYWVGPEFPGGGGGLPPPPPPAGQLGKGRLPGWAQQARV